VADAADGWNMVAGSSVAQVQHKRQVLAQHCDAVGRDLHSIDKSLLIYTALYDTEPEFAQLLADQARLLGPDSQAGLLRARELGLAGSAAQVTDTLARYLACGFDYLIALFPYTRERDMLQRYAENVWGHLS
jgi:alkanesulfonate monooxygenase SsuD/methylene tetrahydromethanopterin reductase-like flavin-dependent oxidoreductase (luciferase family)